MRPTVRQLLVASVVFTAGASALPTAADTLLIPKGTAVELKLESGLGTRSSKVGDTFEASILRPVYIDGEVALPPGTRMQGRVEVLRSARDGAKSGVIGIEFTRLMLPGREPLGIDGEMTSLRQDDRRKLVEEAPRQSTTRKSDVLIIGQERKDGKAPSTLVGLRDTDNDDIAASWARSGLGPTEVEVPQGAPITMEFGAPLSIPSFAPGLYPPGDDARHISTSPAAVKTVQIELAKRQLYNGEANGALDYATRRALIRFQLEKNEQPTGDLDAPTLTLLGVTPVRRP